MIAELWCCFLPTVFPVAAIATIRCALVGTKCELAIQLTSIGYEQPGGCSQSLLKCPRDKRRPEDFF